MSVFYFKFQRKGWTVTDSLDSMAKLCASRRLCRLQDSVRVVFASFSLLNSISAIFFASSILSATRRALRRGRSFPGPTAAPSDARYWQIQVLQNRKVSYQNTLMNWSCFSLTRNEAANSEIHESPTLFH